MAKLMSGKAVADALGIQISERAAKLKEKGIVPTLAVIRCGAKPSDLSYERGILKKAESLGIEVRVTALPEDADREMLAEEIVALNRDDAVHGVLLFRPLPEHLRKYQTEICNMLSPAKDVDCMTDLSNAGVYEGRDLGFAPCTPEACMELLKYYGVELKGKNVTVIGRSLVVGKPAAMMLMAEHATVTVCHTRTVDVAAIARKADIIVTSAGAPGSLTRDHVAPGQTVVDISINWDPTKNNGQGGITGDCVFDEVEPVVDAVTPVPGGVGAVTTTVLLGHVVSAAEKTV